MKKLFILLVLTISILSCKKETSDEDTICSISYKCYSTRSGMIVAYTNSTNGTNSKTVTGTSYNVSSKNKKGTAIACIASSTSQYSATITCEIYSNGVLIKSSKSTGVGAMASAVCVVE